MTTEQLKVRRFHEKAGATINDVPTIPSEKDCILRLELIREELEELAVAFAVKNFVPIADAIGDLLYVVYGTAVTCGIDIQPIFNAIHESNMTKFIDGHRRADGKWIKGPSYKPVDLQPLLEHQILDV